MEALVAGLAGRDRPDWLDALPACSEERVPLPLIDEHGSPAAWARMAISHPRPTARHLVAAVAKGRDSRVLWRVHSLLPALVGADPDAALDVVEALFAVEGQAHAIRPALQRLATVRPQRTFDLIRQRQAMGLPAPLSGLFGLVVFHRAEKLGLERLKWAVAHAPAALPDSSAGRDWLRRLTVADRDALVTEWLARGTSSWGAFLFASVPEGPARERSYLRWRTAAENREGVVAVQRLDDLPWDLREREARRHLSEVVWLQSRPVERRPYARLLPWAEAETQLSPWIRHPEGEERAAAWRVLLAVPRHDRVGVPPALAAVRKRKNEQYPVRLAMHDALAAIPPGRVPDASLPDVEAVVDDALDAADLSGATARAAQLLAARVLDRDPARGMALVAKILRVRGSVDGSAIGGRITPAGAVRLDGVLADLTRRWVEQERASAVITLAWGLDRRLRRMPLTLDAIDGLCASPHLPVLASLLTLLRRHAPGRFAERAIALVVGDPSAACLADVARVVATRRTDLLDPLLAGTPMTGRWATGRTHWVLDFGLHLDGWTPDQQARYGRMLDALLDDPERDVPTCRWAIERLAVLHLAPAAALIARAADPRPPVRDIAIRALPSLDGGAGIEALVDCMGDDRARVAAYALRRAIAELPRTEIVDRLRRVPMTRVTVAKEVLRMLGELGGASVRDHLVAVGATPLHRDVRIALLRALWDHIEHPPAWALLESAAKDPDPILVGRLLSIPMGRLSRAADARLCTLFGDVLARPEPEARLGFLAAVPAAPLRDESRVLLGRLVGHLATPDPAESAAALRALLARMYEGEVPVVTARIVGLLPKRPHALALLAVVIDTLTAWSPTHHRALGVALAGPLCADRLAGVFAVRLLARIHVAEGFAAGLEALSSRGHLHHDAITAAIGAVGAVGALGRPDALAQILAKSGDARLRRVALAALQVAASPENGWIAARRELLAQLQRDPSLEVAAPAAWVVPPG